MKTLYTIGEVSKLANVSIKALRYYDKIDLFKPAYVDPTTNYRYYKDSQFPHLNLIKSLKYIGAPLQDMKRMGGLEEDELFAFLTEQELLVRKKLDRLLEIEQMIMKVKERIQKNKTYPVYDEVFLSNEEERRIIQTKAIEMNPENILNASFSQLKKFVEMTDGFMDNSYGATFTFLPYTHIGEISYNYIFTPILTDKQVSSFTPDIEVATIPKGQYICIVGIFSFDHYFKNLQKLISYIITNQLTAISDIYEFILPVSPSPNAEEEYIIEMKIRVSKSLVV